MLAVEEPAAPFFVRRLVAEVCLMGVPRRLPIATTTLTHLILLLGLVLLNVTALVRPRALVVIAELAASSMMMLTFDLWLPNVADNLGTLNLVFLRSALANLRVEVALTELEKTEAV